MINQKDFTDSYHKDKFENLLEIYQEAYSLYEGEIDKEEHWADFYCFSREDVLDEMGLEDNPKDETLLWDITEFLSEDYEFIINDGAFFYCLK